MQIFVKEWKTVVKWKSDFFLIGLVSVGELNGNITLNEDAIFQWLQNFFD